MSTQARRTVGTNAGLDYIGVHNFIEGVKINEMGSALSATLGGYKESDDTQPSTGAVVGVNWTTNLTQNGRVVTMTFQPCFGAATVGTTLSTAATIPAELRPPADVFGFGFCLDDSVSLQGYVFCTALGVYGASLINPATGGPSAFTGTALSGNTGLEKSASLSWTLL